MVGVRHCHLLTSFQEGLESDHGGGIECDGAAF